MPFFKRKKSEIPPPDSALPGRNTAIKAPKAHYVNGNPLKGVPDGMEEALFGLGCFWGAERQFWKQKGVFSTAVGYAAGSTINPTYEEVCSGMTGHNEVVYVIYDPKIVPFETLLKLFWESHNPTQGMRQGNDRGTQYRSGVYYYDDAQKAAAERTKMTYQKRLKNEGHGQITTEIIPAPQFFYAEVYHQQYLAKNPGGYCGLVGTGTTCHL